MYCEKDISGVSLQSLLVMSLFAIASSTLAVSSTDAFSLKRVCKEQLHLACRDVEIDLQTFFRFLGFDELVM